MNLNRNRISYLGLFANTPPAGFIPVPAETPVIPQVPGAPPGYVPVATVIDMAEAIAQRNQARQNLTNARQPQTPVVEPEPTPVTVQPNANDEVLRELRALRKSNTQLAASLQHQQLETYRANAISTARAGGQELIDTLVGGANYQEIDASVQFAVAEYRLLEQQFQRRNTAPVAPVQQVPQGVQGVVTSTQITSQQQVPQIQEISAPSFITAPGIPDQGGQIDPAQLAYLTSSESIRNGTYAQNRQFVSAALRSGMQRPPDGWSFDRGYSLGPPMPQPVGGQAGQPAMMGNPMGGVVQPQIRSNGPQPGYPQAGTIPGMNNRGVPTQRAPTPQQFQHEVSPGQYVQTGTPDNTQLAAARQAAESSRQSNQGRFGSSPHGQ